MRPGISRIFFFLGILAGAFFAFTAAAAPRTPDKPSLWSMGFWDSSAAQFNGTVPASSLDFTKLTHLVHVTAMSNADGTLTFNCSGIGPCSREQIDAEIRSLVSTAHKGGIKVLMGVATRRDGQIGWVGATSPANLAKFVSNIMSVVDAYGYDGVDIDWEETPVQQQTANLISALRTALGPKILTADAMVGDEAFWAGVAQNLDRVNVMTYDLASCHSWKVMWFNSPIYSDPNQWNWSLDLARQRAISAGIPPAKLNLGIPFYGYRLAQGSFPRSSKPAGCTATALDYNQIIGAYDISTASSDLTTKALWMPVENGYVTFESPETVAAHAAYIQDNRLGGWIIWKLQGDYVPSSTPSHHLLAALPTVNPSLPARLASRDKIAKDIPLRLKSQLDPGSAPANGIARRTSQNIKK